MTICPAEDVLRSYENGQFTDSEAERIERHLESCSTCRTALEHIRSHDPDAQVARSVFRAADAQGLKSLTGTAIDTHDRSLAAKHETISPSDNGRTARQPTTDSSGWPIPDYERVVLCGEGSYGSVWAVRDRVGVHRALKMIDLQRLGRARAAQRERSALETYCRKISRHPYLVTIHHIGLVGNILYYTMELADDRNTSGMIREEFPPNYQALTLEAITKGRRLQVDVAMEIARRLLRGLAVLHGMDLVHCDIKPSNVIFVNRQPKLADIGLVSNEEKVGSSVGTPRYMPPDRRMDKTGDTYAFGKMLHEMIAGRDASCFPSLPDAPWESGKWDRGRLDELLQRACADTAAARFPSAAALLEELEACADLTFDFLGEDVANDRQESKPSETVIVALACIRTIPWILGFIAFVVVVSKLLR